MRFEYDVIVIGAGHAGCEAAAAAARLGSETLLITSDMNRIAQMSCNPAVGGIAKGQIVREVDALGGQMGIVTDRTAVQFRMLNRSKGPAMWSPRAQSDRTRFIDEWRKILDATPNLYIFQDTATEFVFDQKSEDGRPVVTGVRTLLGLTFKAQSVVLTAGTFLNGLLHFGETQIPGGRISELASYGLTEQLKAIGFETQRMKTGTPARIDGRTVNFSLAQAQSGDDIVSTDADGNVSVARDFHKFSFLPQEGRTLMPRECWIVHTNPDVHRRLHDNLDRSPLYNGQIQSIGPRYCPSIETKIVTFADKDSHQLFLEPEGETTEEYYINGFSSSLPWDVQIDALKQVEALKDVHFYRPGYAIEYDYFDPTQLRHTLQTKLVDGLFFAGQVNGTTGYEEAAGQGLIAGVNAHNYVKNLPDFVLKRDEAYIGVLIDDLVTKGVDEPYRMFTSRAEYRILLRQDDADMRLTPRGYEIGLVTEERYQLMVEKRRQRDELIEFCRGFLVKADKINPHLPALGCVELKASQRLYDLILRPQLDFEKLRRLIPALDRQIMSIEEERRSEIVESAEILIKYSGYIERERLLADKIQRLENLPLGDKIDYDQILSLSTEARQKLAKIRPATIAQASRIPGISPADINILLMLLGR
ncbi:MAG: tRNA uridine-5-carboxymethylaminomethyl(34) synthesis enzyme MnmG [Muribaculaceae bacterium]|nr:tRNA uridine-5-carboxymethylaminomethyl(34) synthesis enzyme MnmG [Muribaculaceae bacterium]